MTQANRRLIGVTFNFPDGSELRVLPSYIESLVVDMDRETVRVRMTLIAPAADWHQHADRPLTEIADNTKRLTRPPSLE